MKKLKVILLLTILMITLCACGKKEVSEEENLMDEIVKNDIAPIVIDDPQNNSSENTVKIMDFSLNVLNQIGMEENVMISPISIVMALSMTANGAKDETLAQMEEVLGVDIANLNDLMYAYKEQLPIDDKNKVSIANSIWIKDTKSFKVEKDFLQKNKDYFDAQIFQVPFDNNAKNKINNWAKEKTDGQIDKILNEAPPEEAVMYLINALSFDAEWDIIYRESNIREDEFTNQKGEKQTVEFMNSEEHNYISLPDAVGFSKPYANQQYSFVALLPNEGIDMTQWMNSLTGDKLMDAIKNGSEETVKTKLPKFTFEYGTELSKILKELGMVDAFHKGAADFSGIGIIDDANIFISRIIHKTKIEVDEKGTKAGAITAVEMSRTSESISEIKQVILNRPFCFMIVDHTLSMPLFIGIVNDIK